MKNKVFLILLVTVSFVFSCKNKWNETANLKLEFTASQTQIDSAIKVTQVYLIPAAFNWYGQRKQADNVTISNSFTPAAKINLLNNQFNEIPLIEIPQGTYTDINSSYNFKGNTTAKAIEIALEYTHEIDEELETITILIQLENEETVKMLGITTPIDILSDNSYVLNLNLDFAYLFAGINHDLIENAQIENETIIINSTKNQNLYSYLSGRINGAMSLKMK